MIRAGQTESSHPRRLFHFHIFKNAGSTIIRILSRNYPEEFCSFDGADASGSLGPEETRAHILARPDAVAFTSHQAKPPLPSIEGSQFLSLIFIRHPIDRIGSIYHFEKRRLLPDSETSIKTGELTFREYVEWFLETRPTRNFFNFQCLFCSSKRDYLRDEVTENDFQEAAARLVEMGLVGVVDRFEESIDLFSRTLRPHFPEIKFDTAAENVSAGRQHSLPDRLAAIATELGPSLFRRLREENEFDLRLYEFSRNLLASRRASSARAL